MKNYYVMTHCLMLLGGMLLNAGLAWPSTAETIVPVDEESIAGAPAPPSPLKEDRIWDTPKELGGEYRFFDKPFSAYNFPKSKFRLPDGSVIPIKSPGRFPGIEFGVEMNSFRALQQVVPPERLSKSLNSEQNQPRLLSPTTHSPDYNGGFLRFTW